MEKKATAGIKSCKKGKGKVPVDQLPYYTHLGVSNKVYQGNQVQLEIDNIDQ